MREHPVATAVAALVSARDPHRLAAVLTPTARLRALLPGGPLEAGGAQNAAALLCSLFADFDTVEVADSAGEPVGDRLVIHNRFQVGQHTTRWVVTQTAVCTAEDGRLSVIDLLCSGFQEIENDDDLPTPDRPRRVG